MPCASWALGHSASIVDAYWPPHMPVPPTGVVVAGSEARARVRCVRHLLPTLPDCLRSAELFVHPLADLRQRDAVRLHRRLLEGRFRSCPDIDEMGPGLAIDVGFGRRDLLWAR